MLFLLVNNKRSLITIGFAIAILTLVFLAVGDQSLSRMASLLQLSSFSAIGATTLRQVGPKALLSTAGQTPRKDWQDRRESFADAGGLETSFDPGLWATT